MTKRQMKKRFASGGTITTMEDGEEAVLTYCDMCGKLYKGDYGYEIHSARRNSTLSTRRGLCASCAGKIVPIIEKALDDAKEKEHEVRDEVVKDAKNKRLPIPTRLLRLEKKRGKMSKYMMRVILKSGAEFIVKCERFTVTRSRSGGLLGYEINDAAENKPIYLNLDQVEAIVQLSSDEE